MTTTEKKRIRFRFPLWAKTLTLLVLSVFIVSGAAIAFFSSSISSMTRNHYIEHSVELADTLGVFLDLENIKTVKNKVDEIYQAIPEEEKVENSLWGEPEWEAYLSHFDEVTAMPEYIALFDQISLFHSKNDVRFTYLCYADLEKSRLIYLVDDSEPEERCLPGSFDDFTESDMAIYDNPNEGFAPEITNMPEYGYLVAVGRPIFDGPENIVAFALVDLSMDAIIAKEHENTSTLIVILVSLSAGTVLIGSLLVLFFLARPLRRLTHAANEYTAGDDDGLSKFARINIRTKDEIEDLSNSMKKMEKDLNRYIADLLGAEKKVDEMKHLADKDALTDMNNKRAYFEIEERLNGEIKQNKARFAITMIDLNNLKLINDTLGHEKGDEAIIALATSIKEIFKYSMTYRVGGDEFVAVSENGDLERINDLEKELREALATKDNTLAAAIGIAVYDPKLDNNFEDTFKRADSKMYQNKKEIKSKEKR